MSLRDVLSPNPRLTQQEYEIAQAIGRKRYAVRGSVRMAWWLLGLAVVIFGLRGYTSGDWRLVLSLRTALEVAGLVLVCSTFIGFTTYTLVWKALGQMFGPKPGA